MSTASVLAKGKMQSIAFELSVLPRRVEYAVLARKVAKKNSTKEEEKKQKKEEKAKAKKMEKEAEKAFKEDNTDDLSEQIMQDIIVLSGDDTIKSLNIIKKANDAKKLIQYAYFYMTDERADLIKKNQIEREVINGIAAIFEFGKIYDSAAIADLKRYDLSYKDDFNEMGKYLFCIADLIAKKQDVIFMEKLQKRKEQLAAEKESPQDDVPEEEDAKASSSWQTDENGVVHPVFIPKDPVTLDKEAKKEELPIQGAGISDELFKKLEDAFTPLVGKHRYELQNNGMITLFVTRDIGLEEFYTVDPGLVMGKDKLYVMGRAENDVLFVSTEHTDIVKNILGSAFYALTAQEIQKVIVEYFRNMKIYKYLDMSNTGFMNKLSEADFQKFGKKITFILSKVQQQSEGIDMPRFRINHWGSVDDFIIISDPSVKSPLTEINETSAIICEGLIYEVKGDKVIQHYKGSVIEYVIEKYGDM